jgi:hypothetical protein
VITPTSPLPHTHSTVCSQHFVRLFDSVDSRIEQVAGFLAEGLLQGETVIAVLADHRWRAIEHRLRARGIDATDAIRREILIVRDATATLQSLTRDNRLDEDLFDLHVGDLVAALCETGRIVRAYGEMVDVLVAHNDFGAAMQLEGMWNRLAARHRFTLFCGYSAVNFGDVRRASALLSICQAHSHASADADDLLSSYLLAAHASA